MWERIPRSCPQFLVRQNIPYGAGFIFVFQDTCPERVLCPLGHSAEAPADFKVPGNW